MTEAHATISTAVIDDTGPEPVMHVRCWDVPASYAARFAAMATAIFGQPSEMISDPHAMVRAGERAAAEDGAVYLLRGEGGTGG